MKKLVVACLVFAVGCSKTSELSEYLENPDVISINREAAHATFFPFENRKLALADNRDQSENFISLNGIWKFKYSERLEDRPVDFFKSNFDHGQFSDIHVPGNWEAQGFGIPYYLDEEYPFKPNPPHL